jgi:excisionase family DNA binding protein
MANSVKITQPAVLSSWKEIAAYLGKGVRTVQRWEQQDGLPVRRIAGTSKIVAYREELDRWLHAQPAQHSGAIHPVSANQYEQVRRNIEIGRALRKENSLLIQSMKEAMRTLMDECARASTSTISSPQPGNGKIASAHPELVSAAERVLRPAPGRSKAV